MSVKKQADWLKAGWLLIVPLCMVGMYGMYNLRDHNKLIVMSPDNTYHISEYSGNENLRFAYERIVRDATIAFLMRNPNGLDEELMFKNLFTGNAREKALIQIKSEAQQFKDYQIHQKVERQSVDIRKADKNSSIIGHRQQCGHRQNFCQHRLGADMPEFLVCPVGGRLEKTFMQTIL
ncbi:MAG: hypothetical protein PHS41_10885 [Victivallaceae bacterium]|nr:hypothetical protein [Victivallaceae bacterium]